MKLKWEPKYGPAFLTGLLNIAVFIAGWAVIWFNLPSDLKAANASITKLETITNTLISEINKHENRLIKTETGIEYIVPALKRIEDKVDKIK